MLPSQHCRHSIPQILKVSTMMIFHLITHVPWLKKKLQCWKSNCVKDFCTGLCSDSHRHTALPSTCFPFLVKLIHGSEHVSVGSMLAAVNRKWFTPGFFVFADKFSKSCVICFCHNIGKTPQVEQLAQLTPDFPF